ncbi:Dol-P-Man:Man(5)GlcNAc(2)-PP-Dol alpha-1,3-mannosyltransferase [Colletotrichum tanaceti]|uniref:Dol-P-Man:Man(5)GlcNAc(2)-PP-Dol alpha-1,3-mannosyltransferase n=1 Tax=Colletotrichum tanaceti TaxID=1306861 RepID=A0A4U6XDS3_9PEZI|nr:Dol-P-Man:Man(5)GlcNAc(2)-PP-Dol alpha-1,3-mannosyltransferase [Colletotrichum tanaceti]TKW53931.1 Dol-P-Man:Man(5)GlcNAc(2)-PP-Dol alpha-1,3-mannosyltransferase [Colletotrichum tanaceti]
MDDAPASDEQLRLQKDNNINNNNNNNNKKKKSSNNRQAKDNMSKLSPSLKALINAPFARPGQAAAPSHIGQVYQSIARDAASKKVGTKPWLAISAAATFTLNSPESLESLYSVASSSSSSSSPPGRPDKRETAEFIREVGLKCISFNGIPRTINCLNAFYDALPADVTAQLETRPTRAPTARNLADVTARGQALWDSIYAPFEVKLRDKLARSHPDLPVHILHSHYAALLSDPAAGERGGLASVGRVLTSVVAISCLRAQTGVGPQVLSHVFGLRKGLEDGFFEADAREDVEGARWLASDEGSEWILRSVDAITEAIAGASRSNFAPARESKL